MISVEKPGSPEEILEHFGRKGMKWGVRKAVDTSLGVRTSGGVKDTYARYKANTVLGRRAAARTPAQTAAHVAKTENRKKIAKRVAIGVAATSVVAASAFVAYKLNQNRLIKASEIQRAETVTKQGDAIFDILSAVSGGNVEDLR
jgi:hypothetical protein